MKTCADRQNLMLEYLYDLLDDVERHDLQGHADSCPSCATALRQAQTQKGQMAAAAKREFPNVRFVAPVESQPATLPFHRMIITHPWTRYALAASVLIAAVVTLAVKNPWKNGTVIETAIGHQLTGDGMTPLTKTDGPLVVKDAGNPVDGLQASITLTQPQFKLGARRILVGYQIQNVSKDSIFVWRRNFWPNHKIIVVDERDDPVPRTPLGEGYLKQFDPKGDREPGARKELTGNEFDSIDGSQNLALFFKFEKPGTYRVHIIYEEGHPDGWKGELSSNIEKFTIVP
jgi:hypothetical protein